MSKDRGKKWDGKSRVSTDLYRKRYDDLSEEKPDIISDCKLCLKSSTTKTRIGSWPPVIRKDMLIQAGKDPIGKSKSY